MDYQARVGAWLSVLILAGERQSTPWQLPGNTHVESFICEADHAVDDIVARTSSGGLIFFQAKRSVELSRGPESPIASAISQFVRQFIAGRQLRSDVVPLDVARDRIVLVTGLDTGEPIRNHLKRAVSRIAQLDVRESFETGASDRQKEAFAVLAEHVNRTWKEVAGREPSREELRRLLLLLHIEWLTVDPGGPDERASKFILGSLLRRPSDADTAWIVLIENAQKLISRRGSANRESLIQALSAEGIAFGVSTPIHITSERLHDETRLRFPSQLRNVAAEKYDRALYVPRIATEGIAAQLANSEMAFRSRALPLIERLRMIAPPPGRDAGDVTARAGVRIAQTSSVSQLDEIVTQLKSAFAYDDVENVVRQINTAVATEELSFKQRFAEVIPRIIALSHSEVRADDIYAGLSIVRQARRIESASGDANRGVTLKSILRHLPSEPYEEYEPLVLANDLIRELADAIEKFRRRCLAVVAPAGHGKTNALCALGESLLTNSPVMLLDGEQIIAAGDVPRAIATSLRGIRFEGSPLSEVLPGLEESGQHLFILIDALDEARSTPDLIAALRELLNESEENRLFIVVACRDTRWIQFEETVRRHLVAPPIHLNRFENQEWRAAWPRYTAARQIEGQLSASAEETLRNPLLLRLFVETNAGASLGAVHDLRPLDVFKNYITRAVDRVRVRTGALNTKAAEELLEKLARTIWDEQSIGVDVRRLGIAPADLDSPVSTYNELRNEGVLRAVETDRGRVEVRFTYDELAEFMIARAIERRLGSRDRDEFVKTATTRLGFLPAIGVLIFLDRTVAGVLDSLFTCVKSDIETIRRHQAPLVQALRAVAGKKLSDDGVALLAAVESVADPELRPMLAPVVLELLQHRSETPVVMELAARVLEIGGIVPQSGKRRTSDFDTRELPPARHHYEGPVRLAALTVLASTHDFRFDGLVTAGIRRLGQSELAGAIDTIRAIDDASDEAVMRLVAQLITLHTPEYRIYCAWLLRRRYGEEASERLMRLLLDEHTRVYRYAARIVQQRGIEAALLERMVNVIETDPNLRPWHLTQLIGLLTEAAPVGVLAIDVARLNALLQRCSKHPSASVRMASLTALLDRLTGRAAAELRALAAADSDPSINTLAN